MADLDLEDRYPGYLVAVAIPLLALLGLSAR
jgi:hypothetical protein